jgi:shikimate dehydrogenase
MAKDMNFKQELVGCFGFPVAENPTQAMIEPAFVDLGLDWRYLTLEVKPENLEKAVNGARSFGFKGFNCTIPHKVEVIQYLDGLGSSAELMGAVNCVVNKDGKLIGKNTDGKGFVESLKKKSDPEGKSCVIFGAGGAARAISVEMALAGCSKITIINRSIERAKDLIDILEGRVDQACSQSLSTQMIEWKDEYHIPSGTDYVINATSIGLYPDIDAKVNINISSLTPEMIVADVIPNPPKTRLIRDAVEKGCTTIDGLEMLVGQGVIGIEYWTGQSPNPEIMRNSLEKIFSS